MPVDVQVDGADDRVTVDFLFRVLRTGERYVVWLGGYDASGEGSSVYEAMRNFNAEVAPHWGPSVVCETVQEIVDEKYQDAYGPDPDPDKEAKMPEYNGELSPDEQITAEEGIASIIFDFDNGEDYYERPSESDCAKLGRCILRYVLSQFRPDLFTGYDKEAQDGNKSRVDGN